MGGGGKYFLTNMQRIQNWKKMGGGGLGKGGRGSELFDKLTKIPNLNNKNIFLGGRWGGCNCAKLF